MKEEGREEEEGSFQSEKDTKVVGKIVQLQVGVIV
jgi:hypothetical protein